MPVYNQKPRPRVLFEALPPELAQDLAGLVPTSLIIDQTTRVAETEFDLLVTFASDADHRSPHLHVLSFGAAHIGSHRSASQGRTVIAHAQRTGKTLAMEVVIPTEVNSEVRMLLERTVITNLPLGEKQTWVNHTPPRGEVLMQLGTAGKPYALLWRRSQTSNSALTIALPAETTDHRTWLVWFLRWLHDLSPTSFPGDPEWSTSRDWASAETIILHDELSSLQEERARVVRQLEADERAVQERLDAAQATDQVGLQRLLVADGEELEASVVEALSSLGFTVMQMDDHHDAVTKAKLEDLRVTDPADPDWIALVEVKGYSKGARTSDIPQIVGRPMRAYMSETSGKEPSTVWHIVNHERLRDPTTRTAAVPNDLDLQPLVEANGSLIETRQIFMALRDVKQGAIDAGSVREALKDARVRWDYRRL